ncbi:hypothetical protein GC167_02385 [bacterium]|nr:hypothetical protein [bacterium]
MEALPFVPEQIYHRRQDIHRRYGGNWQSGICPSSTHPYIFIFSGATGKQHGYRDGWENPNVFAYTGEGQQGDMQFVRGNLALRDHVQLGKRVFLFDSLGQGRVRFVAEVSLCDVDWFETHDSAGQLRLGIKFFFQRLGAYIPVQPRVFDQMVAEPLTVMEAYLRPSVTERSGLVTSRVGQGAYRKSLIHRWNYACAVTGFDKLEVLIASHIVPWSKATDAQRLDVDNGILLSPTYDALFDRHLISFDEKGRIILSTTIEKQAFEKIGVVGKERIDRLSEPNQRYLDQHRTQFGQLGK